MASSPTEIGQEARLHRMWGKTGPGPTGPPVGCLLRSTLRGLRERLMHSTTAVGASRQGLCQSASSKALHVIQPSDADSEGEGEVEVIASHPCLLAASTLAREEEEEEDVVVVLAAAVAAVGDRMGRASASAVSENDQQVPCQVREGC